MDDIGEIYHDTNNALMDFYESNYCFPGMLAHQVMAADILGNVC